jgi:hypothetical protein
MAILSNGLTWWFYLPMAEGYWEERRFAEIDLGKFAPTEGAGALRTFLSRAAWRSKSALTSATVALKTRQKALGVAREHPIIRAIRSPGAHSSVAYHPPGRAATKLQLAFELLRKRWVTKHDLEALTGQSGGWQLYNYQHYVKSGRYGSLLLLHKPAYSPAPMRLATRSEAKRLMKNLEVANYRPQHRKKHGRQPA